VEVNTGGINRGKTSEVYPSPLFLRLLKERNVPLIITADAHKAEQLDGHYADAVKAMREAGYTETVFFEGRLDGISQWNLVKI
jgi:histidinol-phosphatase (PHP family)